MSDAVDEAQRLYKESIDALTEQRRQIEEDLAFSDPSDPQQWDQREKAARESDPGGIRPCLVFDQTGQYVTQVSGQLEKQPPSLHAIPVSGGADKKAAEQLDGRFRHIEHASRASQHYARAMTSAARVGVGYLTVRPDFVDRALQWQEPRISSEPDPLKVVLDPWSVETDGTDADYGFILTQISEREFKRRWPKADLVDFAETEATKRAEGKSVLTAEYWHKVYKTQKVVVYTDETGEEKSAPEDEFADLQAKSGGLLVFVREYTDKLMTVRWCRFAGGAELESSQYLADSIGIVPVYGYVSFVDGRMKYCGIPRRARAPQQAYNYHMSEMRMPGAQLLIPHRALAGDGVQALWDKAQVERRAYLPFADVDEAGPITPPSLIKTGSSLIDHASAAQQALRDIQAAIGMYQANLGAPSNETSGVAIDSRKEQGENSTAHFPSHMAASLTQVGQIVMQMDARLSDTRRTQPILGIDGAPGNVQVDPAQTVAFQRLPNGGGVSINPAVGKYAVRVVVGASYTTQRTQTNAAFAEIMRGNKELAPTVAPFWAQTLDFPNSDKFAQAMAAMAPPAVKALLQPEGGEEAQDPSMTAQRLAEVTQALQAAVEEAHAAQQELDEANARADASERAVSDKARELDIKEYEAETKRFQVVGANAEEVKAITTQLVQEMLGAAAPQIEALAAGVAHETAGLSASEALAQAKAQEPDTSEEDAMEREAVQALLQGQQVMQEQLGRMMRIMQAPRHRIPVRNVNGDIERVIDQLADQPEPGEEAA